MFEWLFKMFTEGQATLPARGMQAIPDQLVNRMKKDSIRYEERYAFRVRLFLFLINDKYLCACLIIRVRSIEKRADGKFLIKYSSVNNKKNDVKTITSNYVVIATDPISAQNFCSALSISPANHSKITAPEGRGYAYLFLLFV